MNEQTTEKKPRGSWNDYFMRIAHEVATRATCDRKHVGCVLVIDRRIVATGFNGSIRGLPHCDDVDHDLVSSLVVNPSDPTGQSNLTITNCVRTMHAEANAVAQAARFGIPLEGARAYVNTYPCWPCYKLLASSGIATIFYDDEYRIDERIQRAADQSGTTVIGPNVWKNLPGT